MKKVSIIIVNWNGKDDTLKCLATIKKMKPKGITLETIVVDNGSTNDSVSVIKKQHPWVRLIETGKNLGFTGGNNVGMEVAMKDGADFLWLLNNDTLVTSDAWRLIEAFDVSDVGIAGSKIYFAPGYEYHKDRYSPKERGRVFWYAGGLVDWANMYASHKGVDEVDYGQYDTMEETPYVTGCSFMIARDVVSQIGVLDDRYYLYLEDLDYCLRAKRAGFRLMYNPASVIWHVNAGSSGGAGNPLHEYYMTRNRLYVGLKYAPLRTKFALLREAMRFIFFGSANKRKAIIDALIGKYGKQYEPKKIHN
jgi:GT2 family glycosyltransferase